MGDEKRLTLGGWWGRWDWSVGHNVYGNFRSLSPALSLKGEGNFVEPSAYFMYALSVLGDPVCEEDIEFMGLGRIAVGGPNDLFAIRGEHGRAVKFPIERNLFWFRAIVTNHMEMEGWTALMI